MKSIRQFWRLLYINHILAKNGLDEVIVGLKLFRPFRFVIYFNPWTWCRRQKLPRGEAIRLSLETLGPLFVKFGQTLSTRPDILPADIALELCKLQDKVPPFSSECALNLIEAAYGKSPTEVFATFDATPMASASIAQVHAATLKSGQEVVVKILRPHIRKMMDMDLGILHIIASFAEKYWKESRRFKPKEVVAEFKRTLIHELNFRREAANAAQFKRLFKDSPLLYIPQIYWDYVHENILVMERIDGIPITDLAALNAQGVNIKKLAQRGLEIFFTQVFRDSFFHADMHPGNIFVDKKNPHDPRYICVDFGIVGTLSASDNRYLAENLLAFFNRDYRRVALLHIESGWIAADANVEEFESAIRTFSEPIFEKPLKEISFALLMLQLFSVARQFHMTVQPELVLLQKTLLAVEGLGRQLYPDLSIWDTGKPYLEKWLKAQVGPKALLRHLQNNIPFLVEQLPYMPKLLYDVLSEIKSHARPKCQHVARKSSFRPGFWCGVLATSVVVVGLSAIGYGTSF